MAKFKSKPLKQVMCDSGIIFFSDKGELETENKLFIETLEKCSDVTKVSKSSKADK